MLARRIRALLMASDCVLGIVIAATNAHLTILGATHSPITLGER